MYRKIAAVAMVLTVLNFGVTACGNVENSDNVSGKISTAGQGGKGGKLEYRDTKKEPVVVTLRWGDGSVPEAVYEQDSEGNAHMTMKDLRGVPLIDEYFIDEKYYDCAKGACAEDVEHSKKRAGISLAEKQDRLERSKNNAKYLGEESCSAGVCDSWDVEGDKHLLDKDHRLVCIVAQEVHPFTDEPTETIMEYRYGNVPKITLPQIQW